MSFFPRTARQFRNTFLALLVGVLTAVSPARSQLRPEFQQGAEKMFADGLALYTKGAFADAARVFDEVLVMFPRSHRETAAWVMKGKALLYAGDLNRAEETLTQFLRLFSFSTYMPDAEYALGLVYVRRQRPELAVETLLRSLQATDAGSPLRRQVIAALDSTIDLLVSVPPLHRLIAEAGSGPAKEFLLVKLGEKLIEEGRIAAATATLDSLEFLFPQPSFAERRLLLRKRLLEPRTLKIGVVLPLMRNYEAQGAKEREVGISLYEGMQLAFEEFRESGGVSRPIVLEVKDTEREPARAAAVVKELCAEPAVIGIIGPPFSAAAFAVAYHANTSRVPLLTPTANADGIAATGPYVFQANPDFTARAKAMARYAVQSLRLTRLGVLSPNEPNSRIMAQAFAAEATRLGAEVLPPEFYEPGSTNLGTQLMSLRKRANDAGGEPFLLFGASLGKKETAQLARMGVAPRVLDSLLSTKAVVNAEQLLGGQARTLLDGAGIPYRAGDPHVDSIARPVTALHGLYCPIASPEEIGIVSSQVAYFNLQTKLLGSGEWNNERELNTHRRYCSGVVFESDSYTSPAEPDYARFASRFVQRFGKRPNRNTVYGYDVATVVFTLLQRGALTREHLREALATMPPVQTLHGKVSFGTRRVNPWLHILEYTGTVVQRVGEVMTE